MARDAAGNPIAATRPSRPDSMPSRRTPDGQSARSTPDRSRPGRPARLPDGVRGARRQDAVLRRRHHPPPREPLPRACGQHGAGRQGTAENEIFGLLADVDEAMWSIRHGGVVSGEGIIHAVRDARGDDEGADEKRLLLAASEMSALLKVMDRQGTTVFCDPLRMPGTATARCRRWASSSPNAPRRPTSLSSSRSCRPRCASASTTSRS